eukprot:CAMPEP_0119005256 /NCGR_PEP_ID=MMETSP1176-20130426/1614_1 /TAXON_ID=265551 /ORGANISM="Synedropsis recta cf, Strain CCMP1620" /LENGTH=282 /DNA_ID=CAMNT_0006957045 /DNA_START=213 /DNA_END=1057 /DNA_ORIENTATION=+
MATYQEEYERIKEIHKLPTFLSRDFIQNKIVLGSLLATAIVTLVNFMAIVAVRSYSPQARKGEVYYAAYKLTFFISNTWIAFLGLYYYVTVIETNPSIEQIAMGFKESIYPIMCVQAGKNLWAIPAGMIMIEESMVKQIHHISVLLVAFASSSFTCGFSYFLPLMFGVFEISSIPLAIVELFKDNPGLIKRYPSEYTLLRLVFAASFLYIRWYLFLPGIWDFLRLSGFAIISIEGTRPLVLLLASLTWIACCFLGALQIYWGVLIVNSVVKAMLKQTPGDAG